tara:strand:- start:160 stop:777 length:618 start_codon:yes stop_codon:yes gene_type:complete
MILLMKNTNILPFKNEVYRKSIHLLSSLIPIAYIFFNKKLIFTLVFFLFLILLIIEVFRFRKNLISLYFNKILGSVVRNYEQSSMMSATLLVMAALFCIIFFDRQVSIISLLILSVSDSLAAIFGLKYGHIRIINNKSLEGTYAFIISALAILFFTHFYLNFSIPLFTGILSIVIVSIIEHVTPTKFDNITTPISSCLLLTLFNL